MQKFKYIMPAVFSALSLFIISSCNSEETATEEQPTVVEEQQNMFEPSADVYDNWEHFYKRVDEHFVMDSFVSAETTANDLLTREVELTDSFYKCYGDLLIYNKDSSKFIDVYSYSTIIEFENGKRVARGGEVDNEVSVVDVKSGISTRLLFFGPSCQFQSAFWYNDHIVGIMGLQSDYSDEYYTPRIWFVNIDNGQIMPYDYHSNISIIDAHAYLEKYFATKGIETAY